MKSFIAYCGLDCEVCEARIATVNDDNVLRKSVANQWSEMNHVEITSEMINCSGCRIDGPKTPYSGSICPMVLFVTDCVNVPQRSYGCAFGSFPCQSQKALGHRTNSFNQRLLKNS